MELYVFLITSLVRLVATMVVVFNCFSGERPYHSYSPIAIRGEKTLKRLKKLEMYRRIKAEEVLEIIRKIKSSEAGPAGKNTCPTISKSIENENAII